MMRVRLFLSISLALALLHLGCESEPKVEATQDPSAGSAMSDAARIAAPQGEEPEVAAAPDGGNPLASDTALEDWQKRLQAALDAKDFETAEATLKTLDPHFSHAFLPSAESQRVEAFRGQLNATPEREIVIQVRQDGPVQGHGEHEDFYWIGLIAQIDGVLKLVHTIVNPRLLTCDFANGKGLTFGFLEKAPSEKAGLWVIEQDVRSCGTLVEVAYKKTHIRLDGANVGETTMKGPKAVEYDRMKPRD